MSNTLDEIMNDTNLQCCLECGKCVSVCPMQQLYQEFSSDMFPRIVIKRTLLGRDTSKDEEIWFCLSCTACADSCPAGVKFGEFAEYLRNMNFARGSTENFIFCRNCGARYLSVPTFNAVQNRIQQKQASTEFLDKCPQCRRYDFAAKVRVIE